MALTDQTNPDSGHPDFFGASHIPINLMSEILDYMKSEDFKDDDYQGKFNWFIKLQPVLKLFEGVLFLGNVVHNIHGNLTDDGRLTVWFLLEIDLDDDDHDDEYIDNNLSKVDWKRYKLDEFDGNWITKKTDFLKWNIENTTISIDLNKQFQFKHNLENFKEKSNDNQ